MRILSTVPHNVLEMLFRSSLLRVFLASSLAYLGGLGVHRWLSPRVMEEMGGIERTIVSERPLLSLEQASGSLAISLATWLEMAATDPLGTAPTITTAMAALDQEALAQLAETWATLEAHPPSTLAARLVHDALFFRWATVDPAGLLGYINQGPRYRMGHDGAIAAAILQWALRNPSDAFAAARSSHQPDACANGILQTVTLLGPRCASALAEHLNQTQDINLYRRRDEIPNMLVDWAMESPSAAVAWLSLLHRNDLRRSIARPFFTQWAKIDATAATKALEGQRRTTDRDSLMRSVAQAWHEEDPIAATAWAEACGVASVWETIQFAGLWKTLSDDPLSLTPTQLAALPRGGQRASVLRSLVSQTLSHDFERTKALIDQLPKNEQLPLRLKLADELADEGQATFEASEALDFLADLPPGTERAIHSLRLAARLGERDPEGLFQWLADHPEALDHERMLMAAVKPWVKNDLAGAQDMLRVSPDSPASRELASEISRQLLEIDPDTLLSFAKEIAEPSVATHLYDAYDIHQAKANPVTFLKEAAQQASLPKDQAVHAALENLAQVDLDAAVTWAREQADRLPQEAMERLARAAARTDLAAARTIADAVVNDPKLRNQGRSVVVTLTNAWTDEDPVAASTWALAMPPSELRNAAVENVANHWSRRDWPAARRWIESLPPGALRDTAIEGVRWPLNQRDPRLLLDALPLVSSETTRTKWQSDLFSQWVRQDRAAAHAAAEEIGLSSDEMQTLFGETP